MINQGGGEDESHTKIAPSNWLHRLGAVAASPPASAATRIMRHWCWEGSGDNLQGEEGMWRELFADGLPQSPLMQVCPPPLH